MIGIYPHTATIEPVATRNSYGAPATYGTAATPACMVVPEVRKIVGRGGEEIVARGYVVAQGPLTIAEDSVVTLPTAMGYPSRLPVVGVEHFVDPETFGLDVVRVFYA